MANLSAEEVAAAAAAETRELEAKLAAAKSRKVAAERTARAERLEHLDDESGDPCVIACANLLAAVEELARKAGVTCDATTPVGGKILKAKAALGRIPVKAAPPVVADSKRPS